MADFTPISPEYLVSSTHKEAMRHPDYVEHAIASLRDELKATMAVLVLAGYKFECCELTPVGNRWWVVRYPNGFLVQSVGGLYLPNVVIRTWQAYCREERENYRGGN